MFQRTVLRASRQAARRQLPAFAPLREQVGSTRAAITPAIRWYSDAPATPAAPAATESEAPKKEDASATEAAKAKELLEKKDKEIVDLKV